MNFQEAKLFSMTSEQNGKMCRIRPVHNKGNLIRVINEDLIIACLANTCISPSDLIDEWEVDPEDIVQ